MKNARGETIEYFWELKYPFGEFLKSIFGENVYKRKYSLSGDGIYNLLYINNKIYEIKYTESKKGMLENDNHKFTDDKEYIIKKITENLKTKSSINGGKYITFPVGEWIAKVEIIKKIAEPV